MALAKALSSSRRLASASPKAAQGTGRVLRVVGFVWRLMESLRENHRENQTFGKAGRWRYVVGTSGHATELIGPASGQCWTRMGKRAIGRLLLHPELGVKRSRV